MWKAAGNSGERFIAFSFAVIALATVFFTPVCLAQDPTTGNPVSGNLVLVTGSTPIGTQLLDNAGSLTVAPGGNYIFTVTLTSGSGTFQLASTGQVAMSLSAYTWPGFASNNYTPGPLDSNVTLSSFQYVDSTHASFALSVSSGASTGVDQIQANEFSSGAVWPVFIQPSSPPGLPNPPSPSTSCGTPSITSVTPDTWMAGQSYPITIVGSGFTNAAMAAANSNCTANQLTVSVPAGSVTLSNVVIMDSTKITATAQPAQTDPAETATLILWGAPSVSVLVARARTGAVAETVTAMPADGGGPPGLGRVTTGNAKITNPEITVIAWVNPNAPDILAALTAGPSSLSLENNLNSLPGCLYQVYQWLKGHRTNLGTPKDVAYANAWLLNHSGNATPPLAINPQAELQGGDFRLLNDFGGGHNQAVIGMTPIPCPSGLNAAAQSDPDNNYDGSTTAGDPYQIAEGRLGEDGRAISQTINGHDVGWIWSVIELDQSGNPTTSNHGMFPTYWVYKNGNRIDAYPQSAATDFINQNQSYHITPSDVQ